MVVAIVETPSQLVTTFYARASRLFVFGKELDACLVRALRQYSRKCASAVGETNHEKSRGERFATAEETFSQV
jgi:hypothetical protein